MGQDECTAGGGALLEGLGAGVRGPAAAAGTARTDHGPIIKPKMFENDEPLRRSTPTVKGLVIQDDGKGELIPNLEWARALHCDR